MPFRHNRNHNEVEESSRSKTDEEEFEEVLSRGIETANELSKATQGLMSMLKLYQGEDGGDRRERHTGQQ